MSTVLGLNAGSYIKNGTLDTSTVPNALCLVFTSISFSPGEFGNILNIPVDLINVITADAAPYLKNLGCEISPTDGSKVPGN